MSISRRASNPIEGLLPSVKPEEPIMVEAGVGEADTNDGYNLDVSKNSPVRLSEGLLDTFLTHYRGGIKTDALNALGGLAVGVGNTPDPRLEKVKLRTKSIYLYFK